MNYGDLRKLLLDWTVIDGHGGPGTLRDGRGAWHVFCHLAAAAAIYRLQSRGAAWVGIVYDEIRQQYIAAVCVTIKSRLSILPLRTSEARELVASGKWLGYLEGASRGHILDRSANDVGDSRTDDRRQDYDQSIKAQNDGGPVWEMWTVSRDIRASNRLGSSIVEAYNELLAVLGGRFAAVVARGRMEREYGHLRQMCAMIDAGLISAEEALTEVDPIAIPSSIERILMEATPEAFMRAATVLVRGRRKPCYFMYSRKLSSFAPASLLRKLVTTLGEGV